MRPSFLFVLHHEMTGEFCEGLYFAFGFVVVYSTSRTLGSAYGYNALKIGLVLLSYGIGLLFMLSLYRTRT